VSGPDAAAPAGGVAGERHVSAVAGRRSWLSRRTGVALLLGTTAIACGVILLRAATAPDEAAAPDPELQVRPVIRYEPPPAPPPAPPLTPANLPATPPGPPLPPETPTATLADALRQAQTPNQGQPRLLVYGSPGGGSASAPAGTGGQAPAAVAPLPATAGGSELEARLQPSRLGGAAAGVLRHQPYLLTTGAILPCILQTAMDSTLPGLVSCVIPQDVRGKTGLTLLDRGTRVVG
jgi:type IV secretion system protein VirB10